MAWEPATPVADVGSGRSFIARKAPQAFLQDPARPAADAGADRKSCRRPKPDGFSQGELNTLAGSGLAVQAVDPNGVPANRAGNRRNTSSTRKARSDTAFLAADGAFPISMR